MNSSYPPDPYRLYYPTPSTSALTLDTNIDRDSFTRDSPPPPTTPPPTPFLPPDDYSTAPGLMFELTRSKLERAAQGQLNGRRGAPGLRELVLLSNVFSGVARPQWMQKQQQRDRDAAEIERKQKEDEAKWLDGVLEEMLVDGDGWDDEDDFVSVSFRDDRGVGDSGFLEAGTITSSPHREVLVIVKEEQPKSSGDPEDQDEQEETDESNFLVGEHEDSQYDTSPSSHPPLPPSPPLPPRSPPIPLPGNLSRGSYRSPELAIDDDGYSSSPPFYLPALTPDCSPPGLGAAPDLLGSSFDSLESTDLESQHLRWLDERNSLDLRRAGLFSHPRPTSKPFSKSSTESLEKIYTLSTSPSLESLAFGPSSPTSFPFPSSSSLSPTGEPLALSLLHTAPPIDHSSSSPSHHRPSRTRHLPTTEPAFSSFQGEHGIVKSFYDCVDFGGSPRPNLPACNDLPRWIDLASSSELKSPQKTHDNTRGRDDLALVFANRPNPLSPDNGFGPRFDSSNSQGWRARSLSPEEGAGKRRWEGELFDSP